MCGLQEKSHEHGWFRGTPHFSKPPYIEIETDFAHFPTSGPPSTPELEKLVWYVVIGVWLDGQGHLAKSQYSLN